MTAHRWEVPKEKAKPCDHCKEITTMMVGGSAWINNGRCCERCYQVALNKAIKDGSYYRRRGSKEDWDEYYYLTR